MPVAWRRTASGTIFVEDTPVVQDAAELQTYIYARVSSPTKREDLKRQVARCTAFCEARGWVTDKVFQEVASDMNDNRKVLNKVLDLPPGRLVVEHKDRLTASYFDVVENLLVKLGWQVIVLDRSVQASSNA